MFIPRWHGISFFYFLLNCGGGSESPEALPCSPLWIPVFTRQILYFVLGTSLRSFTWANTPGVSLLKGGFSQQALNSWPEHSPSPLLSSLHVRGSELLCSAAQKVLSLHQSSPPRLGHSFLSQPDPCFFHFPKALKFSCTLSENCYFPSTTINLFFLSI